MLRAPLLYLSSAVWARQALSHMSLARRTASRFVSGQTADDAVAAIRNLNRRGINATLDHLGESVTNEAEAVRAADDYVFVLGKVRECGVRSNVSLKLTQMGLDLGEDFCVGNVRRVLAQARALDTFVRVDMEGTPYTDATIRVFRALYEDFHNVGLVVQAYLYRTEADLKALVADGVRIRLCKGAYKEPPDKAFPRKADVDANYVKLAQFLLDHACDAPAPDGSGRFPPLPALATHDEKIIELTRAYAAKIGLKPQQYEFQMLFGIRRELQDRLAAEGNAVRVYVPYGTEWYPYFMRRLAERPANLWFFISNLVRQ